MWPRGLGPLISRKGLCCGEQGAQTQTQRSRKESVARRAEGGKAAKKSTLPGNPVVSCDAQPGLPDAGNCARSPAAPGRWAEQSRARLSIWPITRLCRLSRGPAPPLAAPPCPPGGDAWPRARSAAALASWVKLSCARQSIRPIARCFRLPRGSAPGSGAPPAGAGRVPVAVGMAEGGSVRARE